MAGRIRVGTSGFSYPGWVGSFYPPGTRREQMLARYAERLPAVEVNMTFRRMPQPALLERWRDQVPGGFVFALKIHQRITHTKRLSSTEEDVADFVRAARTLGDALGPILVQTPPSLAFDPEHLGAFLAGLPGGTAFAFEPRHPSFANPEVNEALAAHGVARCLNDDETDPQTYRRTAPFAYLRLRREDYTPGELASRAETVRALASEGADVHVFFKHTDGPEGADAAVAFRELVC